MKFDVNFGLIIHNYQSQSLLEKFPITEFFLVRIFPYSDSVSLRIQSKCGKIRTRKNSVFGHFSRSELPVITGLHKIYINHSLSVQSCKLKKHWWMIAYMFQKHPENFSFHYHFTVNCWPKKSALPIYQYFFVDPPYCQIYKIRNTNLQSRSPGYDWQKTRRRRRRRTQATPKCFAFRTNAINACVNRYISLMNC